MLGSVPLDTSVQGFRSFHTNAQTKVFPYLDLPLQKKVIQVLTKLRAAFILNTLSSDDRIVFYSSLKGIERSHYLELLNEKNKDGVHDILGYPDNSVARLINQEFATIGTELTQC